MTTVLALLADAAIVGLFYHLLSRRGGARVRIGSPDSPYVRLRVVDLWLCDVALIYLCAFDTMFPPLRSAAVDNTLAIVIVASLILALVGMRYIYRARVFEWRMCFGFLALTLTVAGADSKTSFSISPGWYSVNLLLIVLGTSLLLATFVLFRRARA